MRLAAMLWLAAARALVPRAPSTTRRMATAMRGGKRGGRRLRHEQRTLDFSEPVETKPKPARAHPALAALLGDSVSTPEATLEALRSKEVDAPTLASGVASLVGADRVDLAKEVDLQSLAADPRALTTAVNALCRAGAPEACTSLVEDVISKGVARSGRVYGPIVAALLDKRRRPYDLLEDWVRAEAAIGEACEAPSAIPFANALQACRRRKDLKAAYLVLDAFAASGCADHPDLSRELSTIFARSVRFIVGAAVQAQLPVDTEVREVAFVGRSNVGKSSLVNMFLGRTKAAYVSKKPGKTRQFNVFDVNSGNADTKRVRETVQAEQRPWAPSGRFRLVDVPGSGYAKISEGARDEWRVFLKVYLATRSNLGAVCHLVDSRVGLQKTDFELFAVVREVAAERVSTGLDPLDIVVVLTKVDKKSSRTAEVLAAVRAAAADARVVATSSKEGVGRAALWRALRGVVLPASP